MDFIYILVVLAITYYILKALFGNNTNNSTTKRDDSYRQDIVVEKTDNSSDKLQKNADELNRIVIDILDKNKILASCLVFIGRSDGQLMTKEIDVIAKTILKISGRTDIETWMIDQQIRDIKKIAPEEFFENVKILSHNQQLFDTLQKAARKIIATQKNVQAGELYCLGVLDSYLKK